MAIIERRRKTDGITSYLIDFRDQTGARVRECAGTTRTQAKRLLEQRIGEVRSGTYRNPKTEAKRAREAAGPTFEEFAERFMRDFGRTKRSTHYSERIPKLSSFFEGRTLRDITRADLDRYLAERRQQVGPSTTRKDLSVLSMLFRKAIEWGIAEHNPMTTLVRPKEPHHKVRWLTRDEFDRLQDASPPWLRPILTIAVSTGLRLKEICNLQWGEIDEDRRLIYVSADNKTATGRVVPLTSAALAVLRTVPRRMRATHVFVTKGGEPYRTRIERGRIAGATRDALRRASIEGASLHTLRHSCASWMVQAGVPLYEVQAVLGHSTPMMTLRYAHLAPGHLRGAADAMDRALSAQRGVGSEFAVDTQVDTWPKTVSEESESATRNAS